jgi:hypothetical protein
VFICGSILSLVFLGVLGGLGGSIIFLDFLGALASLRQAQDRLGG